MLRLAENVIVIFIVMSLWLWCVVVKKKSAMQAMIAAFKLKGFGLCETSKSIAKSRPDHTKEKLAREKCLT